jgi:hypothetical protein
LRREIKTRLPEPLEAGVFEDEGLAAYGFELDDDAGVLAWGGFHDGALAELGVGDDAADWVLGAVAA